MQIDKLKQKLAILGLRERESQLQMIAAIAETIKQRKILCVEAPTGVGKTLAYLLASLENKTNDEVVIISTATIALQNQILNNDIPLAEKILGRKIKAAIAKGRRRYVCRARLYEPEHYFEDDDKAAFTFPLQQLLEKNSWNGERDDLSLTIKDQEWQKISTDSNGCHAGRCSHFEDCVFFQARRRIEVADVIIANHNLLLSDLSLGGGVVLPETKRCLYVIDECHQFAEKAISSFAEQAAVMRSTEWINTLSKSLKTTDALLKLSSDFKKNINNNISELVKMLTDLHRYLQNLNNVFESDIYRVKTIEPVFLELIKGTIFFSDRVTQSCEHLVDRLNEKHELLSRDDKEAQSVFESAITTAQFVLSRSESLASTWQLFLQDKDDLGVPVARWIERKEVKHSDFFGVDYTAHASPVAASRKLKELFWDNVENSVVMCSATVRALGEFKSFSKRLGLNNDKRFETLALPSSFDFSRSIFYLPNMQFVPQNYDDHIDETADLLPELIFPEGGTLILFTSKKAMRRVFELLPEALQDKVLMQGEMGKSKLIAEHKKRIDQDEQSIIFGLASFAEGLDLPGNYCSHVIIHKLPFAVPSDPIELTRSEWLKKNNLNPFMLISLPQASIKLTQYVGRLIRTEEDEGVVTVLDKRLVTKFYGKQLLANLPGFKKILDQPIEKLKKAKEQL